MAMFLRNTAKHGKLRAEHKSVSPLFIAFFGSTFPFPHKRHRSGTCHYDECRETSQHTLNTHNDPAQPYMQRTSPAQALQTELEKCLRGGEGEADFAEGAEDDNADEGDDDKDHSGASSGVGGIGRRP